MNDHRRGNGIRAYHSCIIFLLLIMALTPSAAAAPSVRQSVSATSSSSTVMVGNPVTISGVAEGGNLAAGVQIWIFGGNYIDVSTVPVNAKGEFSKIYKTTGLDPATYYIFVQSPGSDGKFASEINPSILQTSAGKIQDAGAAAQKLSTAFNQQGINDMYTKLTLQIVLPTTVTTVAATTPAAVATTTAPTLLPTTPFTLPPIPVLFSSSSNSGDSNLTLPIIVILVVLLFAGGGYAIYRMKRKPSGDQPNKRKEITAIVPPPSTTGSTTKPKLAITLAEIRLIIDKWHKVELTINNIGDAHASDIQLAFSDDFETRGVTAVSVKAKESVALSIGIKPKTEGDIPIEITASYKDGRNKDYQQVFKFWIDVAGKTGVDSGGTHSPVDGFTPKSLTPKQLPPDLADRYTESEFIGKGGFARVFKAKRKDGKYVAVKIPISMDAVTGKSFIAEMQNWTNLSHPNIVRLYDFNIMPMPFFEEELCDSALADQNKPIESEEAAWILFNICEGLKFAHAHKIIHRDLKPQNILLKNGVPKISDWGLSRIISVTTTTSAMLFTPYYAAPEQINNRVKDERTDIWQLGVILYELVTGVLPFKGDSMVEIGMNISTKDPVPPGEIIPDTKVIDAVVMKCLQKDPKNRYQSVLELQKDLAMYLRENYAELLRRSVSIKDYTRSAYYCGDLVMINLLTGDMKSAYKYLLDFVHYSKGDVKIEAQELSEQIKMRMEEGVTEIPDELIQKAEILVHQVSLGFRNRG